MKGVENLWDLGDLEGTYDLEDIGDTKVVLVVEAKEDMEDILDNKVMEYVDVNEDIGEIGAWMTWR